MERFWLCYINFVIFSSLRFLLFSFNAIYLYTLHEGNNKDNNNNNNNNNNNMFTDQSVLKVLCSVHHFRISYAFKSH